MKLEKVLSQKSSLIQKKWVDQILETYPTDTRRFIKAQKDQFANPVGFTLSEGIGALFKAILQGTESEKAAPILDGIIRIRSVQEFSPSQAVGFIFPLKKILRAELKTEIRENQLYDDLHELESRIDDLALIAFDIFIMCREKIYEIRAREAKNQVSRLLLKKGLIAEIPEWKPKESNNHHLQVIPNETR